jgi:hypothetical protein
MKPLLVAFILTWFYFGLFCVVEVQPQRKPTALVPTFAPSLFNQQRNEAQHAQKPGSFNAPEAMTLDIGMQLTVDVKKPESGTVPADAGQRGAADKKADPEAEIRAAMADTSKVLVIVDARGDWAVFPVTGISEVSGNNVTVKAGTFTIADCQGRGSEKKQAEQLMAKWKSRKGENVIVVSDGGKMWGLTFSFGELKADRRFEVKKVILPATPK